MNNWKDLKKELPEQDDGLLLICNGFWEDNKPVNFRKAIYDGIGFSEIAYEESSSFDCHYTICDYWMRYCDFEKKFGKL